MEIVPSNGTTEMNRSRTTFDASEFELAPNNGWSFLGQNSTWWKTFLKEAVQPWKDQCANVFANAFANGGIVNAVSENLEGGPDPDEVIKQEAWQRRSTL